MTDPTLKTSAHIPPDQGNVRTRMAVNATPRAEDIAHTRSLLLSFIVVASSLLPVLIPGILAYAKRDALIALVDGSPASGWLALLASAAVIALQIWMTRRATFRTCFDTLRGPMLEIGDCLWLCRFGVAMLLMVAATFLLVPQGEESLRTLFEHKRYFDVWYYLRACFFHGSVILFAFALWFSSGYLIERFRPGHRTTGIQINFPRILGALACLVPAVALHQASYAYVSGSYDFTRLLIILPALALFFAGPRLFPLLLLGLWACYAIAYVPTLWIVDRGGIEGHAWHSLNRAALIEMFLGAAMSLFFVYRRALLEARSARAERRARAAGAAPANPPGGEQDPARILIHPLMRFPRIWWMHGLCFLAVLAIVTLFPSVPGSLNAAGILVFACASWISIGSMLTAFSEKPPGRGAMRARPLPIFTALILALFGFGLVNDNHPVRQLAALPAPAPLEPSLRAYVADWLSTSAERCPEAIGKPQPMVVVAAEGGGIRAAYWTASVLSALQDRYPCFAGGVAGLSGVSGGSVGSAVFAAQAAQRLSAAAGAPGPQCKDFDGGMKDSWTACSRSMLGRDFLSPALAYLLFPDLIQRFLPFPVGFFDRGAALEQSWERAWRATFPGSDWFAAPFDSLWRGPGNGWRVPALFLNGTWAENGWRLISAPVALGREEVSAARNVAELTDHPIRLSTAAHVSARFTYVSPAGTLVKDGKLAGHVVDGAYFENSGAATAGEILNAARHVLDSSRYRWARAKDTVDVVPIFLVIRFQERAHHGDVELSTGPVPRPLLTLKETTVPLRTLLNARGARGDFSVDEAKIQMARVAWLQRPEAPKARVVEAILKETQAPLPLGWSLSQVAQEEMARQLEEFLADTAETRVFDGLFQRKPEARTAAAEAREGASAGALAAARP
jgi:hypothetical protein